MTDSSELYKSLRAGHVNTVIGKIMAELEAPQIPRSLETVMSAEKCRVITSMARYVVRRIVSEYGIDRSEVRPKIAARNVQYTETMPNGHRRAYTEAELHMDLSEFAKVPSFWIFLMENPRIAVGLRDHIPEQVRHGGYLAKICVNWIAYQNSFGYELVQGQPGKVYPTGSQLLGVVKRYMFDFIPRINKAALVEPLKPLEPIKVERAAASPESVMSPPQSPKTPREDVKDALDAILIKVGEMDLGEVD